MSKRPEVALFIAVALALVWPRDAGAQLAPTGTHYAGRPSDTGHEGPNDRGGYTTAIPLDLPPSRGGLPIPVQITSGSKGFGAAGVGWDVPLSFVQVDRSFGHRRPAMLTGSSPSPRDRITVSLPGRQAEMVPQAGRWVGRNAPDLSMVADSGKWQLFDGNGLTYTFVQHPYLVGTGGPFAGSAGLWLLDTINGPGATAVKLTYDIQQVQQPGDPAPSISIDLVRVDYNRHPSGSCFKHRIALAYDAVPFGALPKSVSVVGDRAMVRYHRLSAVEVSSRASCNTSLERLRLYSLEYQLVPDTQQDRLASVKMFGRQGTPEGSMSIPIASYRYASATSAGGSGGNVLRYQAGAPITVYLPPGTDVIADTNKDTNSLFQSPISSSQETYVPHSSFLDMTGDGRPDLVFEENGQLWIARNVQGPAGTPTFATPAQLTDSVLTTPYLDASSSEVDRFSGPPPHGANREYVWRQAIDVNGDGRIDIVDASEQAGLWMIYLNTPDSGASGIKWVKRSYDVSDVYAELDSRGMAVASGYVPLSRRFTGIDHDEVMCWRWTSAGWQPYPKGLEALPPFGDGRAECQNWNGYLWSDLEHTYVEWELQDINGDAYPDFVFNSSPVDFVPQPNNEPYFNIEYYPAPQRFLLKPVGEPLNGGVNRIYAMFNVRGLFISAPSVATAVFSSPHELLESDDCGVAQWVGSQTGLHAYQALGCGLIEVNGDGIADRVSGRSVSLGTGYGFASSRMTLPDSLHQLSTHPNDCPDPDDPPDPNNPDPVSHAWQSSALRDVTGDGIPDFVQRDDDTFGYKVYVGTGAGFTGATLSGSVSYPGAPIVVEGSFGISYVDEKCNGSGSRTVSGLYDIDGDGKPELVVLGHYAPWHFEVYPLVGGSTWGVPEAGKLVEIDNGYGATTKISYRSAKEDSHLAHQVPFPEIVVTKIETTGQHGLGGTLAATQYAYGGIELFYDSTLDVFRPTAYMRQIALITTSGLGYPEPQSAATITDRYPLDPFLPQMTMRQRFARYLRAGRVRDVTVLVGTPGTDAWSLLTVDTTTDARRSANVHSDTDARIFTEQAWQSDPCFDVMFPYDFGMSSAYNVGPNAYDVCAAHGFMYSAASDSWRGSAGPPSPDNVQVRASVVAVDDYGRVTSVHLENDRYRNDDDLCIETTYATPAGPNERVLTAVASQKVTTCPPEGGPSLVLAEESFEYDKYLPGTNLVSQGLVTAHTVYRHATDTGAYLSTIREYDITYDANANPIKIESARGDWATRTSSFDYSGFELAPWHTSITGTYAPKLETYLTFDEVSDQVLSTLDPNGTIREHTVDGFGRSVLESIDAPGVNGGDGVAGVLVARTYLGFEDGQPPGRRIQVKEFADPVPSDQVATAPGRVATTFLDELGRARKTEVALGSAYSNETLIVGERSYDPLGRVAFEADPYPATQSSSTAYGTTRYFNRDGALGVEIRGNGFQPYTTAPDASTELFPTLFEHSFANHQETTSTRTADALTSGSSQYGVTHESVLTALGRTLTRSTWQSGSRLEYAELAYDLFGQQTKMVRYQNPTVPSNPVTWSWQFDSLGQVLTLSEPSNPPQNRIYNNWGELQEVTWSPPAPEPQHSIVQKYDALSRLSHSEEANDGVTDPATVYDYIYDDPGQSPIIDPTFVLGRLSVAKAPTGDVVLSYDSFGSVNARSFTDQASNVYVEQHGFHADGSQAWLALALPDNSYMAERVDYEYDSAGRLTKMSFDDGSTQQLLYKARTLDAWGRLRDAGFGDKTNYEAWYADTGRRLPQETKVSTSKGVRGIVFKDFDSVGRELARDEDTKLFPGSETFGYDALGRLTSETKNASGTLISQWSYLHDPLGNLINSNEAVGSSIVQMSYQTTDRDRVCRIDYSGFTGVPCNVEYDSVGNITYEPTRSGYNKLTFFNSGDVRTILNDAGAEATFRYDAFGQVQELDIFDGSNGFRSDRRYGAYIMQRSAKEGPNSVSYLSRQFPGPGLVVSRRGSSGPWIFQFTESRGTRFTTDNDGVFVQELAYTPYGEATSDGAKPGTAEFSTEQWNDGDSLAQFGLVQLGARVYDPVIGRFLSRDPLLIPRSSATSNPYAFAFNDPTNFADPTGLDSCSGDPWGTCISSAYDSSSSNWELSIAGIVAAYWSYQFGVEPSGTSSRAGSSTFGAAFVSAHREFGQTWDAAASAREFELPGAVESVVGSMLRPFVPPVQAVPPSRDALQLACNGGDGAACLQAQNRYISQRINLAYEHIWWWTGQATAAVTAGMEGLGAVGTFVGARGTAAFLGGGDPTCFTAGTPVQTNAGLTPIETVKPGDRVDSLDAASCTEPVDSTSCRMVEIVMENPYGYPDRLTARFFRSEEWVRDHNIEPGSEVPLQIEELTIDGRAKVTSIGACTIQPGTGCLVTGTVTHLNRTVLRFHFVGSNETLEPTTAHQLWSADRGGWVTAGDLKVGEHLLTQTGVVTIASIEHLPGAHQVFNFEVAGAHTYLVSALAIKSHNAGCGGANPATKAAASRGSTLHSDKPGMLPDQLRARYPNTTFRFTKPGVKGQDVFVTGGTHPSAYPGSTWPQGIDHADFKPGTLSGARTFARDQATKWVEPTHMLPYDPNTGQLQ